MKFGKNGLPYYQKLFKNSELKWLHLPTSKLEPINNLSIEELDRAGGESQILWIVGHHDDRLAFFVEGFKEIHDLFSGFGI